MMNANDIAAHHRSRLAFIYVRQSSPHQVLHHRESQLRQRSFRQRAADLGWPLERITVIDEDLGVSATNVAKIELDFRTWWPKPHWAMWESFWL